jgi:hypothetical protein
MRYRSRRSLVPAALVMTIAVAILCQSSQAQAQRGGRGRNRVPAPSPQLETITRLSCAFTAATTAAWNNGAPEPTVRKASPAPTLTITGIDVQDGTAEIGGGFRGENVNVKLAGQTLHFLDIALDGTLGVVTVFARETQDGRLQAVYSRTSFVQAGRGGSGEPEMAQYYGDCAVTRS